jgi:DNA-binding MarR family transcriptional regulator
MADEHSAETCGTLNAVADLSSDERSAWRAFLSAHSCAVERVERQMAARGHLPVSDLEVLLTLYDAPNRVMRMAELARTVAMSRSGLTRQVDRLARKGLLTRKSCPVDRRGLYAVLMPQGVAAVEQARADYAAAVQEHFLESLSEADRRALADTLQGVIGPCSERAPARDLGPCRDHAARAGE